MFQLIESERARAQTILGLCHAAEMLHYLHILKVSLVFPSCPDTLKHHHPLSGSECCCVDCITDVTQLLPQPRKFSFSTASAFVADALVLLLRLFLSFFSTVL
jgi:hypothetical protein